MAKDKQPAAADDQGRGGLKQFKIYLPENDIRGLKKIAALEGVTGATKARMIIINFLDNFKKK